MVSHWQLRSRCIDVTLLTIQPLLQPFPKPAERIVKIVHHPLLQRNDSVVGNLNALGTNLGAAFRNVTVTNSMRVPQLLDAILGIERMHFQRGHVDQKSRADEFVVHLMIAQHVANILAKKTFDAFAKLLDAIDVGLQHPPCPIGRVRWPRLERFNFLLDRKIPRNVRDEIFQDRKRFDWFDRHRLVDRQVAHARHAHELRHAVHFGRTRSALSGFAIPSARQIRCLGPLDIMNGIEHDHAFGNVGRIIAEFSPARVTAPDFECGSSHR